MSLTRAPAMFKYASKKRQLAMQRQQILLEAQQQRLALFDVLSELQTHAQPSSLFKDAVWDLARLGKPAAYAGLLWFAKQRWQKTHTTKSGRLTGLVATLWGAWRLAKRFSCWLDLLKPQEAQRREEGAGPVRPSI